MNTRIQWLALALVVMTLTALASFRVSAQQNQMSFFVTSAGSGNGAHVCGLGGADKICKTRAAAAGARTSARRLQPDSRRSTQRIGSARDRG